jgi:ribosomal-protein-alanine N-acetyltransferase
MTDTGLAIPVLRTERLRLEPLARAHSAGMFELWRAPEVCTYSGDAFDLQGEPIVLPAQSPEDSDNILEFFLHGAAEGTRFRWAVIAVEDNSFVGAVGFNSLGACSEYAYHFVPRYWRRGFALEASRAAFAWLGQREVECFIEPGNVASIALARWLGLRATGEFEHGAERYKGLASSAR